MPSNDRPPEPTMQGPEKPQVVEAEIHIRWNTAGQVSVDAPPHPILTMKILGDAMNVLSQEYTKMMMEQVQEQSPIIQPGIVPVDPRVINAAQGRKS